MENIDDEMMMCATCGIPEVGAVKLKESNEYDYVLFCSDKCQREYKKSKHEMMMCATMMCAFCGVPGVDEIQLKECDECDLVRYCSDECQRDHKQFHVEACEKRAAELREELLFKQPESSHLGDCPICCLPLSIDPQKSTFKSCCSNVICTGCNDANQIRERKARLQHTCPFCRERPPSSSEEYHKRRMKRVEMNDPVALCHEGIEQKGKGNYIKAFEYFTKAAELGNVEAHFMLSDSYLGNGVEKDMEKVMHHLEEAAIGGHPDARCNLGCHVGNNGDYARAVKHWIIAANLGENYALVNLKQWYKCGIVSKEDFAAALRAHKAAVDATKSPQREAAERRDAIEAASSSRTKIKNGRKKDWK